MHIYAKICIPLHTHALRCQRQAVREWNLGRESSVEAGSSPLLFGLRRPDPKTGNKVLHTFKANTVDEAEMWIRAIKVVSEGRCGVW